ncbi:MAG: tetrahydrofolate dehydrogenase/cyclohydrolase catalytic domain-containing protein [Verrucomicrobiota bacterium]
MGQPIDGRAVAQKVNVETSLQVERLKVNGVVPGLAVIMVGDDPASFSYVLAKETKGPRTRFHNRSSTECLRRRRNRNCWSWSGRATRTRRFTGSWYNLHSLWH